MVLLSPCFPSHSEATLHIAAYIVSRISVVGQVAVFSRCQSHVVLYLASTGCTIAKVKFEV